jgi:flagellar basal-body rod modification protein FlgD
MAGLDIASIVSSVTNPSSTNTSSTNTTSAATGNSTIKGTIAQNFDTFLKLLTTQLKNQNPLEPLDTNQFTQQLVQFASVEQQINMNTQLTTLVSLQKATQTTQAMSFLGATATVDGATATLTGGKATWTFSADKPATGTVNIKSTTGQTVYTGTFPLNAGAQAFAWDGRGNNGVMNPNGAYTLSITAKDASGSTIAVSSEVRGTVDSVDLTQNPPVLTIGGQAFTLDKIKQVVRPGL